MAKFLTVDCKPVWVIDQMFVYKLDGCGLGSGCSYWSFSCHACYKQGV